MKDQYDNMSKEVDWNMCPRCRCLAEDMGDNRYACWNDKCSIGIFTIMTKKVKKILEYH